MTSAPSEKNLGLTTDAEFTGRSRSIMVLLPKQVHLQKDVGASHRFSKKQSKCYGRYILVADVVETKSATKIEKRL